MKSKTHMRPHGRAFLRTALAAALIAGGGGALAQVSVTNVQIESFLRNQANAAGVANYAPITTGTPPTTLHHLSAELTNTSTVTIASGILTIKGLPATTAVACMVEDDPAKIPSWNKAYTGACEISPATGLGVNPKTTDGAGEVVFNLSVPLAAVAMTPGKTVGIRLFYERTTHEDIARPVQAEFDYSDTIAITAAPPGAVYITPLPGVTGQHIEPLNLPAVAYPLTISPTLSGNTATITVSYTYTGTNSPTGANDINFTIVDPFPAGGTRACVIPATGAVCNWTAGNIAMPAGHTMSNTGAASAIAFTLTYTPPAGTTLTTGSNITINANSTAGWLPTGAIGGTVPEQIQRIQPLALAAGGAASVPATGTLALGAMAALVALTPAALGRRRRKAAQRPH